MADTCNFQPSHPMSLGDEIAILSLQLEELQPFSEKERKSTLLIVLRIPGSPMGLSALDSRTTRPS